MNDYTKRRLELFAYFEESVNNHFDDFRNGFFDVIKSNMGWEIVYMLENVDIRIYYERVSFEIYSTLAQKGEIEYSIDEILPDFCKRKYIFATDETTIEKAVSELKALMMCYGQRFFEAKTLAFNELMEARKKIESYNLEVLEKKASNAWNSGNYVEVVTLYQSIYPQLNAIQKKRLGVSLKKVAASKG